MGAEVARAGRQGGGRVVYVTYDGALDPLGASQVVPYLEGLARRGVELTLLSFEKPARWDVREERRALAQRLSSAGIRWHPQRYHKRPRLPATLLDVARGAQVLARVARQGQAELVHCRGDVAMVMARAAALPRTTRLLYDMRGFFSEERIEAGSWSRGSLLHRSICRVEAGNLRRADGIVVLTRAARLELERRGPVRPPVRVIPTCVDLSRFRPRSDGERPPYGVVYSGSLGTFYLAREMLDFARCLVEELSGQALFLTPQAEEARRAGAVGAWVEVHSAAPADVPAWLRRARTSLLFCRATAARRWSCPTKLAEALATGLPVAVNKGIGDLDDEIEREGVGVLVGDLDGRAYRVVAQRLAQMAVDPDVPRRCRRWAETRYGLEGGIDAYHDLYQTLIARPGGRGALP